jgi:RNA polymerase sigma factor (sigma-70 family)
LGDAETEGEAGQVGTPPDEFEATLEAAIGVVYPVLCQRIQTARFAGWHRSRHLDGDLANEAVVAFARHCHAHNRLPEDPLRYLVAITRHLAKKQYANRATEPAESAEPIPISLRDRRLLPGEPDDAETARFRDEERMELVRTGIEMLTRRQREALQLYLAEPGATQRELGERMGIGEDGFKKSLDRGVERIRQLLEEYGLAHPTEDE